MWLFRGMLYSTKSTHFFVNILCFHYWQMCFAARWNGFAGRIWPECHSLETPDIKCEEEWWQHTPLSESTPTVNGCDLTPSTWIETSEQDFPRFLENLLESGIFFCCATAVTRSALCIIQLWLNYSRHLLTRHLVYILHGD